MSEKPETKKSKKGESKVVQLRQVDAAAPEVNQKLINTLEAAIRAAKEKGYNQVALVMAKPGLGYLASFSIDDGRADDSEEPVDLGTAGVYNLLGTVCMLRKFIEETVETSGT